MEEQRVVKPENLISVPPPVKRGRSSKQHFDPKSVPIPRRCKDRPVYQGMVVTWVTQYAADGTPDFRTVNRVRADEAMKKKLCAICGQKVVGTYYFIGGNKSLEAKPPYHPGFLDPAMHLECAEYSAAICPFVAGRTWVYKPPEVGKKLPPHLKGRVDLSMGNYRPERIGILAVKKYYIHKDRTRSINHYSVRIEHEDMIWIRWLEVENERWQQNKG